MICATTLVNLSGETVTLNANWLEPVVVPPHGNLRYSYNTAETVAFATANMYPLVNNGLPSTCAVVQPRGPLKLELTDGRTFVPSSEHVYIVRPAIAIALLGAMSRGSPVPTMQIATVVRSEVSRVSFRVEQLEGDVHKRCITVLEYFSIH